MKKINEIFFNKYSGWIKERIDRIDGFELIFIPETPNKIVVEAIKDMIAEDNRQEYISGHC